jgi:hypothetical protein
VNIGFNAEDFVGALNAAHRIIGLTGKERIAGRK